MNNIYENKLYPSNGWLVICMAIDEFLVVQEINDLAHVIASMQTKANTKYPNSRNPIQCYELGNELRIKIDYKIVGIESIEADK